MRGWGRWPCVETKEVRACLRICRKQSILSSPASITRQGQALKPRAGRSLRAADPGWALQPEPSHPSTPWEHPQDPVAPRPLCRRSRPEAASGEPGALWWYALSLFCVSPTGSGAGDRGGLPGGCRRALASGGQARPRPLGPPSLLPAHRAPGPWTGGCGFCSGGGGSGGSGHGGRRRGRRGSRGLELPWPRSEPPLPQFPMLLPPNGSPSF